MLGPFLQSWVGDAIGAPTATAWVWWTAQWPLLVGALLFLFAVLLYLGPDVQQPRWQLVTPGAAVSLVIWLAASGGFAFYTSHFGSYNKTWGTLSAVVITLIWLWLTSLALLFGAEVNAAVRREQVAGAGEPGYRALPVGGIARPPQLRRSSATRADDSPQVLLLDGREVKQLAAWTSGPRGCGARCCSGSTCTGSRRRRRGRSSRRSGSTRRARAGSRSGDGGPFFHDGGEVRPRDRLCARRATRATS